MSPWVAREAGCGAAVLGSKGVRACVSLLIRYCLVYIVSLIVHFIVYYTHVSLIIYILIMQYDGQSHPS